MLELAAEEEDVEVCTLYSDKLDSEVDSYVKLMRHNADELVRCLQPEAAGRQPVWADPPPAKG